MMTNLPPAPRPNRLVLNLNCFTLFVCIIIVQFYIVLHSLPDTLRNVSDVPLDKLEITRMLALQT